MIKQRLLFIILAIYAFAGYGQAPDSLDYINSNIKQYGINIPTEQVKHLTPLTYYGVGYIRKSTHSKEQPFGIMESGSKSSLNILMPRQGNSVIYTFDFLLDATLFFDINKYINKNYKLYVGPNISFNTEFAIKQSNSNNPLAFKCFTDASIALMYQYEFGKKRYLMLQNQLYINLMSIGTSSGYTYLLPDNFNETPVKSITNFYNPAQRFLLRNQLSLDFQLKKYQEFKTNSYWRISYYFEGETYKGSNKWNRAASSIMLGRIIKLYNPRHIRSIPEKKVKNNFLKNLFIK